MKCAPLGVSTTPLTIIRLSSSRWTGVSTVSPAVSHDLLDGQVGLVGGHGEQVVEVRVRAEVRRVAVHVGAVEVHQGDVEVQRWDRDQLLSTAPRRRRTGSSTVLIHGLLTRTSEPRPARIGRNGSRWAAARSPVWNIPSSSSTTSGIVPFLAGLLEVRLERDRVEGDERVDELPDLARPHEQSDVGAAPAHERQVLEVGPQDRADQRHRLAPRAPAADADRHAVLELGDDLVDGHPLVAGPFAHVSAFFVPAKSSRSSSLTPIRLSS